MNKSRLELMREYLAEAEQDPENNRLYIEDLKISIPIVEQQIAREIVVQNGFKSAF